MEFIEMWALSLSKCRYSNRSLLRLRSATSFDQVDTELVEVANHYNYYHCGFDRLNHHALAGTEPAKGKYTMFVASDPLSNRF